MMAKKDKIYWAVTLAFLAGFFYFFQTIKPPKLFENEAPRDKSRDIFFGSRLKGFSRSPNKINLSVDAMISEDLLNIKLNAQNPANDTFDSNAYFYRVLLGRSYPYSPAIILKEFSKKLGAKDIFELEFPWERIYLRDEKAELYLHFNLYRRNGSKEPSIIATTTHSLLFGQ
ncbi:MAG: hypothetical protein UX44_C0011G0005 [candidate division WWE3 bacterium GW2011_GWA1_46_21]|uniref:Uncharacterized protein n=2 Tax=Katanobacteria TaxID=422282 RepID=A0A0G1PDG7_UNCKA|nr:MAG: hypothetical protein UX44_C0011G0005 [candidate division WWE3 bacterium GW2011_GWA1_46_21]KKU57038.1 MAG: hypothetical protein UX79_C0025G0005 [candidate division WWE3 bacterium GW2011_GWB1_47_11]